MYDNVRHEYHLFCPHRNSSFPGTSRPRRDSRSVNNFKLANKHTYGAICFHHAASVRSFLSVVHLARIFVLYFVKNIVIESFASGLDSQGRLIENLFARWNTPQQSPHANSVACFGSCRLVGSGWAAASPGQFAKFCCENQGGQQNFESAVVRWD